MRLIFTLIALSACSFIGEKDQKSRLDPDNDGILWPDDCNDNNPNIGAPQTWYIDEDGDGFGSDDNIINDSCAVPPNGSATGGDCDDTDSTVYPTAEEIWYNGIDNDCQGGDDFDADGDGETSSSYDGTDCDDTNPAINTAATEIYYDGIDQDCDNNDNECDQDGDGFDGTPSGEPNTICPNVTDCDDTDPTIYPNDNLEIPLTGIDEDCNFQTGDGDVDGDGFWTADYEDYMEANGLSIQVPIPSAPRDCWDDPEDIPTDFVALNGFPQIEAVAVYPEAEDIYYDGIDANCQGGDEFDQDRDGFQSDAYEDRNGQIGTDCDDGNSTIFPGAFDEFYDGINSNCDTLSDYDQDGDGFDSAEYGGSDCNDIDPTINSFEFDIPADGVDQDCNGFETCYLDNDLDGFGSSNTGESSASDCSASGFSANNSDCDDSSALTYPGAAPQDSQSACMRDVDGDNYGDSNVSGSIVAGTDCDDSSLSVNVGALEITDNGIDDNCDGNEQCYVDVDGDGFRTINSNQVVISSDLDCTDPGEAQASDPAEDCNDALSSINPNAAEVVDDGVDQNCDTFEICYLDADSDGYRTIDTSITVGSVDLDCDDAGEGSSNEPPEDCDDLDSNSYPGATEIVGDGIDQNCDGNELCYVDNDNDGYADEANITITSNDLDCVDSGEADNSTPTTDCNDSNININPGATEILDDGIDQDCDGNELCYADSDNDGYADQSLAEVASTDLDCSDLGEAGVNTPTTDCDDNDDSVYPYAAEAFDDGIDSNCDGLEAINIECEGAEVTDGSEVTYMLYCDRQLSWNSSNQNCQSHGYDGIASLYSNIEQLELELMASNTNPSIFQNYWIGLFDNFVEGSFWWVSDPGIDIWTGGSSGSSPNGDYTNWAPGEPTSGSNFNCTYVDDIDGRWLVENCNASYQMTCEKRPAP